MKKIYSLLLLAVFVCCSCNTLEAQPKVSVLGDSYSTFQGYISPSTNLCWYNGSDRKQHQKNDVENVEQTWWYQLINDNGMVLELNNSYSGATVCCTGYRKEDYSDRAFISRVNNLGNPDVIIVFGGTNDSWAGAPVGEYQYRNFTKDKLYEFRPAFAYLLDRLLELYPNAKIINVTNSELSPEVTESMAHICEHYGVPNIQLHDIDKQSGHPSVAGMKAIAEQIKPYIIENK